MAAVELEHLATMLGSVSGPRAAYLRQRAAGLGADLRKAVETHGVREHPRYGSVYAYEADGFGNFTTQDDANIPSLLSLPYLGYCDKTDPTYLRTRALLLSEDNPYFFQGREGSGIGSPHTPFNYIWPMAVSLQALTSTDDDEILDCLNTLKNSAYATGLMHESFDKDNASRFTRSWFAWACAVFSELILELIETNPDLILNP